MMQLILKSKQSRYDFWYLWPWIVDKPHLFKLLSFQLLTENPEDYRIKFPFGYFPFSYKGQVPKTLQQLQTAQLQVVQLVEQDS